MTKKLKFATAILRIIMKDFGYFGKCEIPLSDEIEVISSASNEELKEDFLISNNEGLKAEIYAPEIDYFLANSQENALNKAKMVLKLYEARALAFDSSNQQDYEKAVGKNVLVIAANERVGLKELLASNGFKAIFLDEIDFIYGCVGELSAIIDDDGKKLEVECDFALFSSPKDWALRQSGCYDISALSDDEIIKILTKSSPKHSYKNHIFYENEPCLYHQKRVEICAKCVEICPRVAILKNSEAKELEFSAIDCIGCGSCVSICPSGAIDNAVISRSAFNKIAKNYAGFTPLVLLENSLPNLPLKEGILPFIIPNAKMLDFEHLLSLALGVRGAVILHLPEYAKVTLDAIKLANEIFLKRFNKPLIYISKSQEELQKIQNLDFSDKLEFFEFFEIGKKYELIANKLELITNGMDLGEFEVAGGFENGKIEINESKCTLCAACAAACNTGALIADVSQNAIVFNESLCVGCEYCIKSCAEEGTMSITKDKITLNSEFFALKILAKDELFACLECGKEFATKKSVERVANMLKANFAGDELKIKSLYCCSDCKAKLALQNQILKGDFDE